MVNNASTSLIMIINGDKIVYNNSSTHSPAHFIPELTS